MIVTGAESTRFVPTPHAGGRWSSGGGVTVPEGRVHAVEAGRTLCGADEELERIFFDLPWHQATSYERCTDCVNLARSRAA